MLTIRQGIRLSAIIDKLDLVITNPSGTQEELGADLIQQLVRKAHRAEQELYAFVAEVRKITPEEAAETDLVEFARSLFKDADLTSFFVSAVKSGPRG